MLRSILLAVHPQKVNLALTRHFGMLSNPNDPHIKYNYNQNDGKSLYFPKFGNSYYDALEYDRILENKDTEKPKEKE